MPPQVPRPNRERSARRTLRAIALFKFFKTTLLIVIGLGALQLMRPDVAADAREWLSLLALRTERASVQDVIVWLADVQPQRLAYGSFAYAALFGAEGVGLWRDRLWAEYVTVVTTLSFIPFEIRHIVQHGHVIGVVALVINCAIAVYLLVRLARRRRLRAKLRDAAATT